ncbi:hypothetical protein ACSLGF_17510 [Bacillus sp. A015]
MSVQVPVLVFPRLQRFPITLKRRQRAKIKIILALCQQFKAPGYRVLFTISHSLYGSVSNVFQETTCS